MSLQTLKKKSEAITNTYANTNTFTINGGPRNLSYIGKSMKNSVVKTPFRGSLPVGYAGPGSPIVFANPHIKAELGATHTPQLSVRNTKSMIATKYKWINGQYPNVWTQPSNNLTSQEYTQYLKSIPTFIEKDTIDSVGTLEPIPDATTCCTSTTNRPSSVRNIALRKTTNNARGTNTLPTAAVNGFSEYMTRLRATTIANPGNDKPFPFYANNQCGQTIYNSPPEWYKNTGALTRVANIRCIIENALNALNEAILESDAASMVWYNLQQNDPTNTTQIDEAESSAVTAQTTARDAAQNFLNLVTQYCQPIEVIQNAQNMYNTEQEILDDIAGQ